MGLQDALRKAAGLLFKLPPQTANSDAATELSSDATTPERVNVDALLAEQGLGPRARTDDTTSTRNDVASATTPKTSSPDAAANSGTVTKGVTSGTASKGVAKPVQTKTGEQIVGDSPGPNLEDIKVDIGKATPTGGPINAAAIYSAAKLPTAPFTAEQMLDMLSSLPSELPLDTKRQTVKVTLGALGKTVGATSETIVADASRKVAALAAYVEHLSKRTDELVASSERDIAALQAQIEEKRKSIANARQELMRTTQLCNAESDRLDDVLEFFSLDVPPSRYATSPQVPTGQASASKSPAGQPAAEQNTTTSHSSQKGA